VVLPSGEKNEADAVDFMVAVLESSQLSLVLVGNWIYEEGSAKGESRRRPF